MKEIRELSENRTKKLRRGVVAAIIAAAIILVAAIVPLYWIARDTKNAAESAKDAAKDAASTLVILQNNQRQEKSDRKAGERVIKLIFACIQEPSRCEPKDIKEAITGSPQSEPPAERNPEPKPTNSPSPRPSPSHSPSPHPSSTHSPKPTPTPDCLIYVEIAGRKECVENPVALFGLLLKEEA